MEVVVSFSWRCFSLFMALRTTDVILAIKVGHLFIFGKFVVIFYPADFLLLRWYIEVIFSSSR